MRIQRVSSKYTVARVCGTHQVSSRAAIAGKDHRPKRNRLPREPQFDESGAARLRSSFCESLPLPHPLDPAFELALRHVLRNPGSMIRPRMVLRVASAYELEPD